MPSSSLVEVEVGDEVEVIKLFLQVVGWVGVENEINANSAFN